MDGPDLKPIWHEWYGNLLFKYAKIYNPLLKSQEVKLPMPVVEYYRVDYKPITLQCRAKIFESEIYEQYLYNFDADSDGRNKAKKAYIERTIEQCTRMVIENLKESNLIDVKVEESNYEPCTNVMAELKILTKDM